MQFLVIAYDYTDPEALSRRMAVRQAHMDLVEKNKSAGHAVYGMAILDDKEKMVGSVMVMEYPDREALEAWLINEPYVTGRVWKDIKVQPCRVAQTFLKN